MDTDYTEQIIIKISVVFQYYLCKFNLYDLCLNRFSLRPDKFSYVRTLVLALENSYREP